MKKIFFAVLIFFVSPFISFAQSNVLLGNLKFEADIYGAKIFKHTPHFRPNTTQPLGGFELRLLRQTFGSKEWHADYHFPLCGLQFVYVNFNEQHLGDAFALMPCIQFNIYKTTKSEFYFGLADGLAYFPKKYSYSDTVDNPISTHINEATQFRFGARFQLPNRAEITTAFSFTHYSNAKINTPNLGVNVYGLHIGYQNFISGTPSNFRPVNALNYIHAIKFDVRIGYARGGSVPYGGPKSPYYITYAGIDKRWCYKNRWQLGLWYEYNKGAKLNANYYEDNNNAVALSNKAALVIGDEFILGKMSFGGSFGYYVYRGMGGESVFQSLHINYVLWSWNKEKMNQIYCGVKLKTYLGVAEYFETYVGCRL
jgi:hypothetical protein